MRKNFSNLLAVACCLTLAACSMKTVREEEKPSAPSSSNSSNEAAAKTETPAAAVDTGASSESHAGHMAAAATPAAEPDAAKAATPAPAAGPAHDKHKGEDPAKALGWLKNGNVRFTKNRLRKDGQSSKDIERLSKGQSPHAIVLSCSDSRVPPEVVFDQKLGEIFVVRNAGEIPEKASIASMEYAVEHLGSRLIVVMGHTSCGAVKAALGTLEGGDAGSPALNAMVQDIHPRLASFKGKKPSSEVKDESWANARGIAQDILARSQIIREKVASGQVVIKTALYNLNDGKVQFDEESH